jgi:endogenous inhibitor of DNA gyrase (YacG/DUF329 family)
VASDYCPFCKKPVERKEEDTGKYEPKAEKGE